MCLVLMALVACGQLGPLLASGRLAALVECTVHRVPKDSACKLNAHAATQDAECNPNFTNARETKNRYN